MKYTCYFLLFAFAASSAASATDQRPNIVVILTDDQGYADISLNPHYAPEVSTPNIDALAQDGVVFSQAFTGGPKRKDGDRKPADVAAGNKNMTPREIERARIREEKRAAKRAAKEKEKAMKKAARQADENAATTEADRPVIKAPTGNVGGPPPSSRFDLSHWKLTLPTSADNTYGGHAAEISAAALVDGFKDPHFYMDSHGAMVFWCPVVGATTEGTNFPRCELREMLQPGNPRNNWSLSGSHEMSACCRVLEVPSYPKVVIGQIHSSTGKSKPLVKLQYYKGHIEALVKESPTKGKDIKLTFPDVELGSDINWSIRLKGGVLAITVNGTTQEEDVLANDRAWADQTFYFKAGVYPQDNEGEVSEVARVSFSRLVVTHSDD